MALVVISGHEHLLRRVPPSYKLSSAGPSATLASAAPLRTFITSGPSVALVLEGDEAIEVVRALNGATDGRKAAPGTVRGDFSLSNRENLVHGSDSPESAAREIAFWFPDLG